MPGGSPRREREQPVMSELVKPVLPGLYIWSGLLCLVLGSLFAALLAALTLTGRVGAGRLAEKYPRARQRLAYWEKRWDVLRVAVMLSSTGMQVGIVTFTVLAVVRTSPPSWPYLAGAVMVVTLVFALVFHTVPRALSLSYADRISVASLPVAGFIARVLYPVAGPIASLARLLHRVFEEGSEDLDAPTAEDEIRSAVDRASTEDLEDEERQIIESVFELGDTVTREIMTPRVDVECVEDTETVAGAVEKVRGSSHSRFPVYHESLDDVRGIAHVKDLLRLLSEGKTEQPVARAVKEAPFVPESMPINDLLTLLRNEKSQTAIVVDEYGGTAGLVSMEDIIEELVGDIHDEYDEEERRVQSLSDGSALLDARLPVDEVNELLAVSIPEDEGYDSVGGFVCQELGRIPKPGEVVEGTDFQVTVQTANARQLHMLRIRRTVDS